MSGFDHALMKVLDAARGGIGSISTGEQLMAALCLNRADWLQQMNYTMAEALERIGPEWREMVPEVARQARSRLARDAEAAEAAIKAAAVEQFRSQGQVATEVKAGAEPGPISCTASLVSTGWESPGYRDTALVFDLCPAEDAQPLRVELRMAVADSDRMGEHLRRVHRDAWSRERGAPLDARPGETRPRWID